MLLKLNRFIVSDIIEDDPVRPHITAEWRTDHNREVFGLYEDESFETLRSVICVAYTDTIPTHEDDMNVIGRHTAVFYTVWSYVKGAGRTIVLDTASYIKRTKPDVERFITLSPKTDMARTFHLRNGASELRENDKSINYEYPTEVIK